MSWKYISHITNHLTRTLHTTDMLELRLMRQFVVVAEELNFRRAAERLHMSQPPLSVAMRNLEESIGIKLLDRSKQYVRLTPAGAVFYRDAKRILQYTDQARERALMTGRGQEGSLRLSFVPSAALDVLPSIFKQFQKRYPAVQLHLTAETTTRQLQDLRSGRTDLAIVVGPIHDASGLVIEAMESQALVVAMPSDHPLAKPDQKVAMRQLAQEAFVSFPNVEGAGFTTALRSVCEAAGFTPRIVQEASQMQAILTLVAGGLGIALVPASMRRLRMEDVALLDIAEPDIPHTYDLMLVHTEGNDNPVIEAFLAMARQRMSSESDDEA